MVIRIVLIGVGIVTTAVVGYLGQRKWFGRQVDMADLLNADHLRPRPTKPRRPKAPLPSNNGDSVFDPIA
jgi:hypothetical protein